VADFSGFHAEVENGVANPAPRDVKRGAKHGSRAACVAEVREKPALMPFEEIAARLGIPKRTVERDFRNGIQKLRRPGRADVRAWADSILEASRLRCERERDGD